MRESLSSRLCRLTTKDSGINQIDLEIKCKTRDGMIFTLEIIECKRKLIEGASMDFAEIVDTRATSELLGYTEMVEHTDGFITSMHELVTIKNSEIARVWVELGAIHTDSPVELYEGE